MTKSAKATIRAAEGKDEPALGELGALIVRTHHAFDARRFIAPTPGTARGYGSFLSSQIGQRDSVLLVAEAGGGVVGYVYASVEGPDWMALRGPAGAIQDIVVSELHRGQGVGRQLLDAALAALEERGATQVVLSTATENAAAQALFKRAGFRSTMIEMTRDR